MFIILSWCEFKSSDFSKIFYKMKNGVKLFHNYMDYFFLLLFLHLLFHHHNHKVRPLHLYLYFFFNCNSLFYRNNCFTWLIWPYFQELNHHSKLHSHEMSLPITKVSKSSQVTICNQNNNYFNCHIHVLSEFKTHMTMNNNVTITASPSVNYKLGWTWENYMVFLF